MKAIKLSLITLAVVALAGCSTVRPWGNTKINEEATVSNTINKSFGNVPAPAGPAVTVAVYGFKDLTEQQSHRVQKHT